MAGACGGVVEARFSSITWAEAEELRSMRLNVLAAARRCMHAVCIALRLIAKTKSVHL